MIAVTTTRLPTTIRKHTLIMLAFSVLLFSAGGGTFRFPAISAALWLVTYASILFWITRAPGPAFRAIRAAWPLLLIPLIALISPLWSVDPARSVIAATQLLFTLLLAIRLAAILPPRAAFTALFIAQTAGIALSLANAATGALPPAFEPHGPMLGIYVQKSWMGKAAFWWAFSAIALGVWYRWSAVALTITALGILLAVRAESVTALLAFSSIGVLLTFTATRRLPATLRIGLPLAAVILAISLTLIWGVTGGSSGDVLAAMGKSSTLTGRTVLWQIGYEAWADHPILGTGYGAFWSSSTFAWEVGFVHAHVDDGLAGFHNAYVEAFVALGVLGGGIFLALVTVTFRRLIRWYLATRSTEAAVWSAATLAIALMGCMDDYFFRQHAPHLIFFAMAFLYSAPARWQRAEGLGKTL